jgi:serine/threonine protein kinase
MATVKKLGRYDVRRKLGEGGMGEVFLAHDTELDREVAIKVLLPEFCCNLERVNRFKLEAKAVSAINHPNILTIYEIGGGQDTIYIVTEFIKGETLRNLMSHGGVNPELALDFAQQIASALTAAHKEGIVHRDIKPENIMVREDGILKVLDFGLAKPTIVDAEAKTLELVKTKAGMVMGSVGYMSPEQARGKEVDQRTDLWSLGVVLYEMLTGKTPFDGETMTDILANIIHKEPIPVSEYLIDAPTELHRIVKKSLRKSADDRYQTAKDFVLDLKNLRRDLGVMETDGFLTGQFQKVAAVTTDVKLNSTEDAKTLLHQSVSADALDTNKTAVTTQSVKYRNWWLPMIIVGLAAVIALGAWFYSPNSASQIDLNSLEVTNLEGGDKSFNPTISPDGKYLAYVNYENGKKSLAVRQIATGSVIQLVPPLESGNFLPTTFSPDSNYVYFVQAEKGIGTLYQVPTLGGTPKKIIQDVDSKIAISPDGKKIAFRRRDGESGVDSIIVCNADGSDGQPILSAKETNYKGFYEVGWSPVGETLLVGAVEGMISDETIRTKLLLVSLKDKTVNEFSGKEWINANSFNWTKNNDSILMVAKGFEQEPAQIWQISYPDGTQVRRVTNDTSGYVQMSFARDAGVITGAKNSTISSLWSFNPTTKEMMQLTTDNKNLLGAGGITFLPDGKLIVTKLEGQKANLYTLDADGKNEKPLTFEDGYNGQAVVSPDGRFIVYATTRTGNYSLWRIDPDGKNPLQLTAPENAFDSKPQISADGQTVIFERRPTDFSKSTVMKVSIEGGAANEILNDEARMKMFPRLSADGKLFAYSTMNFDRASTKFNRAVKVFAFNNQDPGELKKQFDLSLGYYYYFSPDGKNLTYINMQGVPNLFNLPLDGTAPKPVTNFTSGHILNFAWSKDGKKIYLVRGIINNELVLLKNAG